ncbi:type VI secretion protein VgrG, partial [Campylobacter coli]|nr:type VI secretion protein VgrG [Campylobacter coli]
ANTQILIDDAILANSINTNDHLNLKDLNLNKSYSNTLTLLKKNIIFTPSFKAKPKAPNSTQGIVIGESKDIESERNTIYTDEHGRVKVRINLYANQEELDNDTFIANDIDINSSNLSSNTYKSYHHTPFLRVASSIASNHSGFFHTPRIGDEVIISFLDDDIDKPYVSSSLYNGATTMPQYNYPRYKREIATNALSYLSVVPAMIDKGLDTLKLQENTDYELSSINNHYLTLANSTVGVDNTNARARNEITLKNDKDKEEIYILAQKDYKEEIGNNYEQTIKNNKTSEVGALYTEFITLGHMQNIIGFKNVNVGAEYLENTLLSKDTNVGLSNTLNVGISNEVNIGQNHEEKIGNDKRVIINNNLEQDIKNDFIQRIGHNKNETIKGSYVLQTNQSIKFHSKKDLSIETNEYFKAEADDSISFKAKNNCSFTADEINTLANKESTLIAQEQIISQVGENTTITQTKDKIILQVGTTQVIIDSKGLRVKGGDLRAD